MQNLKPPNYKTAIDKKSSDSEHVFLERIPKEVYQSMVDHFSHHYNFKNGERMRIANYYVGIDKSIVDQYLQFIEEITNGMTNNEYPDLPIPDGYQPHSDNLLPTEINGNFSFGSFDMAVTDTGLQNIEFQALATYPVSGAKLNQILSDNLPHSNTQLFADHPSTTWSDFIKLYENIIAGDQTDGVIITDRFLAKQKTNFEFYATQQELSTPIDIVDLAAIYEKEGSLFYSKDEKEIKVNRLYNRILISEALFEDNYPHNSELWKFRFDKKYETLKFINHPVKMYDVSKRLSPYIRHTYNPDCFELAEVAQDFQNGKLKYEDYIWKHKWGAAGLGLILSPDANYLDKILTELKDYIAQKKVNFKIFKTDDGKEKIVELRFMTAVHNNKTIVVPMARIGHVIRDVSGETKFKIHFGDNNEEGYGFSPVVIFNSKN